MSLHPVTERVAPLPAPEEAAVQQYVEVFRRRKAASFLVFLLVLAAGVLVTATLKPVYQATSKIRVAVPTTGSRPMRPPDPTEAVPEAEAVTPEPSSIEAQVDEMSSKAFIEESMRLVKIPYGPGIEVPKVKVEAPDFTPSDVIRVTAEGRSPDEVSRLASIMADLHVARTRALQGEGLVKALAYVRRERDHAAQILEAKRAELSRFRAQYPVAEWASEQATRTKQLQDVRGQIITARANTSSMERQLAELRASLKAEAPTVPIRQKKDNPQRAQLQDKIRALRVERLDALKDFQPTSPEVQAIDDQLASYEKELKAEPGEMTEVNYLPNPRRAALEPKVTEVQTALLNNRETYRALMAELRSKDKPLEDLSPLQAKLDTLSKDQQRAEDRYNTLTDRHHALELREHVLPSVAQVIEHAPVPKEPARPLRTLLLGISLITALFLAVGTAFLLELLDDRTNAPEQVERLTALPTLARVPRLAAGSDQSGLVAASSPAADAYRTLRSSVGFAAFESPIRRLQVTSAAAGDGKTTTSVNLAAAMALDGKKVLIVDTDMRRPALHDAFGVDQAPGLSEVIAGRLSLDDAIRKTEMENLSILPAGMIPPNPAEMLGSATFEALMDQMEERADVIVFDSPACLPVTDPILLAPQMDGVLLVVQSGASRKGDLAETVELLDRARARVIGTVFNRVRHTSRAYYRYSAKGYSSRNGWRRPGAGRNRATGLAVPREARLESRGNVGLMPEDDEES